METPTLPPEIESERLHTLEQAVIALADQVQDIQQELGSGRARETVRSRAELLGCLTRPPKLGICETCRNLRLAVYEGLDGKLLLSSDCTKVDLKQVNGPVKICNQLSALPAGD